jgi:hypothetical protein
MTDGKIPGYIHGRMSSGKVMCTGSAAHYWFLCPFLIYAMHLHWYGCPGLATKKIGAHIHKEDTMGHQS